MPTDEEYSAGKEALQLLKDAEPPLYLTPSEEISKAARLASKYLFSSLKPYTPKSPFSELLMEGFDAEQIWLQIDLQSQPLLSSIRRQVRFFEKNPQEIEKQFDIEKDSRRKEIENKNEDRNNLEIQQDEKSDGAESGGEDFDEDIDDDDGEDEEEEGEDDGEGEMETEERGIVNGVEDRFLKIKELEEYLEKDEAREYGLKKEKNKRKRGVTYDEEGDEEGEDGEGDEDEEDDDHELGVMGFDGEEDGNEMENARYEDFFGGPKSGQKKKPVQIDGSDDSDMDDKPNQKKQGLSTHEKEQEKLRAEIEKMEKSNLEPKTWTLQGEVPATKRSKNSALEVDLDFEHNVRPAPVITEEVTASLEELIKKRVIEGQFDDVEKPPTLPNKAPREQMELDENKSKKGLAELYQDEYVQKTGLVSTALTASDEQKKEASMLFKKMCLKLDALSHFHFTPKPVIEDMSIQSNVPALAIEEIAPLAVSDAAMLAPEEVFAGKGDVKEETELTKADRKRRRAKKKRVFKAKIIKKMGGKTQQNTSTNPVPGTENS